MIRGAVRFGRCDTSDVAAAKLIGTYDRNTVADMIYADLEAAGVVIKPSSGVLPVFPGKL